MMPSLSHAAWPCSSAASILPRASAVRLSTIDAPVGDLDVARQQRALERLLRVGLGRVEPAQLRVDPAAQQHERRRVQALTAAPRHPEPALAGGARRLEAAGEVARDREPEQHLQPLRHPFVAERVHERPRLRDLAVDRGERLRVVAAQAAVRLVGRRGRGLGFERRIAGGARPAPGPRRRAPRRRRDRRGRRARGPSRASAPRPARGATSPSAARSASSRRRASCAAAASTAPPARRAPRRRATRSAAASAGSSASSRRSTSRASTRPPGRRKRQPPGRAATPSAPPVVLGRLGQQPQRRLVPAGRRRRARPAPSARPPAPAARRRPGLRDAPRARRGARALPPSRRAAAERRGGPARARASLQPPPAVSYTARRTSG